MKTVRNVLWGLVLIAIGAVCGLNALGVTDIDIFFDGWWTLFIIVPCAIALFTEPGKTGSLIGLGIGVALLLNAQDVLSFTLLWKLLLTFALIVAGISLIFRNAFNRGARRAAQKMREQGVTANAHTATFSAQKVSYAGQVFPGADLTAVFGGVDCDLRGAVLTGDTVVNACAVFGGINLFVPDGVNVRVVSTGIFGGVDNKRPVAPDGAVTIYVNATCIFGGVDVK